jgi:multiple sugar transport system permease protein
MAHTIRRPLTPQRLRRNLSRTLRGTGRFLVLAFFLVLVVAPLYWLLITSFKPKLEIIAREISYWPQNFTLEHYTSLFTRTNFRQYLANSLTVTLITSVFVLFMALFGGYAMARFRFAGKGKFVVALLMSQMIPGTLLMIPTYLLFLNLKLNNNLIGLTLFYIATNVPFCLITMRAFFERIPASLEEAAKVDGCTQLGALFRIIVPIMFPGIVATFVFAFTGAWNEFLAALLFISKDGLRTIPVGLSMYVGKLDVNWGEMAAGGMIALLPTMLMFAFVQRYVVAGLTAGSVKE